jgi:hypothetical protein
MIPLFAPTYSLSALRQSVAVFFSGSVTFACTGECLYRRVAGLIDGKHLVIGQDLFTKVVERCQITAQIHRRVGHRPQSRD